MKKLPKAIRSATDERSEARPARGSTRQQSVAGRTGHASERPHDGGADVRPAPAADVIKVTAAPEVFLAPDGDAPARQSATRVEVDDTNRRLRADMIVERHTTYSAIGGIVPLPIVNVASMAAIIVRMVKALSALYEVPFQRARARAIVVGLMGGAMPTGAGVLTSSSLLYIVPGSYFIGAAVCSIAAAACTRGIGQMYVRHFESGAKSLDIPSIKVVN
ncbi:MAG TPA: DUF697 domain-containing protein [Pirellulales bacterium]